MTLRSLSGVAVPRNDNTGDMCRTFHKRGHFSSNCKRNEDHRAHNAAETSRLLAYLGDHDVAQSFSA